MRWAWLVLCTALLPLPRAARADIPHDKIKFGIIQSAGPQTGRTARGARVAAQMAAEDFEARSFSLDTEIEEYDSNHPDRAADTVRDWLEKDHIAAVIDVAGTADDAAIARLMNAHHRLFILANIGDPGLREAASGPTTLAWGVTPAALSHAVIRAVSERGGKSWFFSVGNGPLAQALASDGARYVTANGGTVTGMATHALGMRDFGPDLRKGAQSGAKVIALSETGPELIGAVTEAAWLGLPAAHQVAALFAPLAEIEQIGLQAAQGMVVAEPFYWNRNQASRQFEERFAKIERGRPPTETEAIVYSATIAMLHAAAATHSVDAAKIIAELRRKPIPDDMLGTITVGPDLIARHDIYVFRVKRPGRSQHRREDLTQIATIPAAEAFQTPPRTALPQERTVEEEKTAPARQAPPVQAPSTHEAPRQAAPAPGVGAP